jgi:hypothetical protein
MSNSNIKFQFSVPLIHVDFGFKPKVVSQQEFDALAKKSTSLVVAALTSRVGVPIFFRELELCFFPPVGPQNNSFQLSIQQWPQGETDQNGNLLEWMVGVIPMQYKPLATHVAQKNGLRLANGFPHVFQRKGASGVTINAVGACRFNRGSSIAKDSGYTVRRFPLQGDNVFTIETDEHSAIYDNKATTNHEMRRLEALQLNTLQEEFEVRFASWFAAQSDES